MMKSKSVLTVSMIAMMAVASARADIASTTYVNNQVQSVSTALSSHTSDSTAHVTATEKAAWNSALQPSAIANMQTTTNMLLSTTNNLESDDVLGDDTKYLSAKAVDTVLTRKLDTYISDQVSQGEDITALQGDVSSLDSRLDTAEGTISQHTNQLSTLNSEKQAKSDSTVSGTKGTDFHYLTAGTGVGANLVALDTQVKTNADAIATKAAASDLTALTTRVGTAEGAINTLNGDGAGSVANSIASALTPYSTTAQMNTALADKADKATTYTKTEADAAFDAKNAASTVESTLNAKIGTVPSGKTVVGMISEAQTAATYDDTALKGRVKTIEDSDAYNSGITSTLVGKISSNETAIGTINNSNVMKSGIDSTKVAQIATNASNITALQSGKQDTLVTDGANANLAGAGSVSVAKDANGKITITGTTTDISGKADKANISGATKTKITYNNQGIVTAGADLAESDIPTLSISKTSGLQAALDGKQVAGNYITVPAATGTSGKSVLTYDAETTTYYWEEIGR